MDKGEKKQVPEIKEPDIFCEQCAKKITDKLIKEKLGGQEKVFCSQDCLKLFKINIAEQREISKERTQGDIDFMERENTFKKNQVDSGKIVETRMVNKVPGQPSIVIEGYKDGLKPKYIIQNEIDRNNQLIKERKRQLENIRKSEEEDATKPD